MLVNLRATYKSRVFATDASSRSCAAVFTRVPEDMVREIWRHSPRRGIGQRYDDNVVADDANVSAESDVAASEVDLVSQDGRKTADLCSAVGWQPSFRYSARNSKHIVTKDARPICSLVRRLAAEVRAGGTRVLNFVDSSPNVGALAKGCSSSGRPGRHLRQVAPDQLLTDLQIALLWRQRSTTPRKHPLADGLCGAFPTVGRSLQMRCCDARSTIRRTLSSSRRCTMWFRSRSCWSQSPVRHMWFAAIRGRPKQNALNPWRAFKPAYAYACLSIAD